MASSTAAGSVATIESLTDEAHYYYEQTLLDRAIGFYYYCQFAKVADIPAGKGYLIQWDKYSALSAATTPITEGMEPSSEGLTMTTLTAEPLMYGSFVRYTDKLELQSFHPVTREIARLLGEQAGLTADTLARDLYTASGTAQIADATALRTSLSTSNLLDASEIAKAYATLLNYNARGWDFIGGRYAVIMSPLAWYDLVENDAAFRNAGQQALPRSEEHPFWTGEVYDYMRCRFFLTSNAKYVADAGSSTTDVYLTMVIGRDAFGIAGMGGYGFRPDLGEGGTGSEVSPVQLIMKDVDQGGADNPMNMRGSIAWKGYQQERELDSTWAVRIEHACSLGSN